MGDIFDQIAGGDIFDQVASKKRTGASGGWEEQSSAPVRAVKGFAQAVNPAPLVEAIKHPIATVKGLVDTRQQFSEAADAFRSGQPKKGIFKSVAAIPVAGPIAEGMTNALTEKVGEGDYAGAAGEAVGFVAGPKILGKAAQVAGADGIAPFLRQSAEKQYGKVFGPRQAEAASKVVPRLLDERITTTNPRESLVDLAEKRASAVDTNSPVIAAGGRPAQPILDGIQKKIDEQFHVAPNGQGGVTRVPKSPESQAIADSLEEYAQIIRDHAKGGTIDPQQLLELRREWSRKPGERGYYNNSNAKVSDPMQVRMDAAKAVGSDINTIPAAKTANAEKNFWLNTKEAAQKAPEPKPIASGFDTTLLGLGTVGQMLGLPAGKYGSAFAVADIARRIMQTPAYRTFSAVQKARVADLLRTGDVAGAAEMVTRGAQATAVTEDPRDAYLRSLMTGQ